MSTGQPVGLTERTTRAIQDVLAGKKKGVLSRLLFAGPAVIASIAYVDPGNFATNLQAGSEFGYSLLWVVLCANIIAMLFQALSAKLGIVTQKNLAQICREQLPRNLVYAMWAVSEIAAMATDLAEFLGGAIGLSLLLHLPLVEGMVITGIVTYAILLMEQQGYRPIELAIGAFVAIIALCYLLEMFVAPVSWVAAVHGTLVPQLASSHALAVSAGILGATVMPHAIYLHSGLTQNRAPAKNNADRRKLLGFSNKETVIALTIAGMVNMAMVVMAAAAFHAGHADIAEVETAYRTLTPLLGAGAAAVFLVSLLASGISSSVVGTMAGQMIMQGFVGFPIPVWVRRLVTMIPAFAVIALGMNATDALVYSQIVLSFALPVPMIALIVFTSRRDIMGEFANSRVVHYAALAGTTVVLMLNAVLILQTFGCAIPGLPTA
ncbi:Nramp family divalent metal transporter [Paraburkholderia bannensis]|uniref:Nramp family divalent metal transporter n=1 Tax=Paraburkholderia bannensis TaxID=765414 RepID=UPI0004816EB9|nr:Nramp family divalent metal transporter [Paraburkholderia bannensis]